MILMVPFGFSVGDFIAGINLLIDAVHSLNDTNGAQADYEGLGRQLRNLRNGFECIENLDLDATQIAQVSAVDTALSDCRLCIDDFTKRNSRFKSLETPSGEQWTLAALKRQRRKVQWALWKKADVAKFRAAIQLHSDAVQMLLASIQIKQIEAQGKLQASAELEQKSLTQSVYGRVSHLDLQQQRMEMAFAKGQTSLAQALENQYTGIRNEVRVHGRNQGKALIAQNATTIQVRTENEMQYYTRLHIVLRAGNLDSIGRFTADEKVDKRKSREDEPSISSEDRPPSSPVPVSMSVPETDRWEQIRKNAAERAGRIGAEKTSTVSEENMEDGEENAETIESRIARIRRRVAELTGNMPA